MLSVILPTQRKNLYSEATVKKIRSAGFRGGVEIAVTCAEVLQFINANSMQLAGEFGGPIIKRTLDYTMTTIRKFFDAYTYDQLVHVPFDESYFNRK
ncbi:hypothetical protein EVAR_21946_1 [Eumeta japonica]|uniref:Uncharacterized protein n=1 Tax=Eumeta variegata TaxID=151549 RepID=A0A4C1VV87_EUMVA|nr:hypothetical protein EVAR_21946_1 [Eumeta japonica]